ncbi:MAG: RNA methyltransferase [Cyanobacteria bacterium J06633_2]
MANSTLSRIRIVLVEPAGALNLGSIARVMKNMGLTRLILVNPRCHPTDDEALRMAVHAKDLLQTALIVPSLPDALADCHRAVATTGRERDPLEELFEHPQQVLPWLLGDRPTTAASSPTPPSPHCIESALIFGPEDRGLSNTELSYAQRYLRIPTSSVYSSLNLAQAVAICCYEMRQLTLIDGQARNQRASLLPSSSKPNHRAHIEEPDSQYDHHNTDNDGELYDSESSRFVAIEELEGFYEHLEETLLRIGYILPHTADSRMKKFRRLFNRAALSPSEVSMLRGILRQVGWAAGQSEKTD